MSLLTEKLAREMTHTRPIQSQRPLADMLAGMNTMQKLGLLQVPIVSDVAGLLGDIQQYRDEPESRGLLNYSMTGLGLLPFMPNMTVFHGSPHKWLPEEGFSMGRPRLDKIGTGEGNQAFGYGMYFAETPGVARSYADNLSDPYTRVEAINPAMRELADMATKLRPPRATPATFREQLENYAADGFDEAKQVLKAIESGDLRFADQGELYKLDLPDEKLPGLLDWDKPLSQQSEAVREAFKAELGSLKRGSQFEKLQDRTGAEILQYIMPSGNKSEAADRLAKRGIPGLRYLDAGSRGMSGTGRWKMTLPDGRVQTFDFKPNDDIVAQVGGVLEPVGTSNFVIWDQGLLDEMARRMANMAGKK